MSKWIPYIILISIIVILIIKYDRLEKQKIISNNYTDTIYVDKPFKPDDEYNHQQKPKEVIKYVDKPYPVEVKEVVYIHDTITLYLRDSSKVYVKPDFLLKYPKDDKLIQMTLSENNLNLSLLNVDGSEYTKVYSNINTNLYDYNYVNQNLTFKRKPFLKRFIPTIKFRVKPISKLYDLDFGLKYNTSNINYEAGINTYYYPNLKNGLGTDLYIQVSYDF